MSADGRARTRAHTHAQLWEVWHGARIWWVGALSGDTALELMGKQAPGTQKNVLGQQHKGVPRRVSFTGGRNS